MNQRRWIVLLSAAAFLWAGLALAQTFPSPPAALPGDQAAALAAPGESQELFLLLHEEQADLSAAYRIQDWEKRGQFVLEALRQVAQRTQPAVLASLNALRWEGSVLEIEPHYLVNAIVVRGDMEAVSALAHLPAVGEIFPIPGIDLATPSELAWMVDSGPQGIEWNIIKIRADQVWNQYGITGAGSVVGNIDNGVEYTHSALVNQYRGNLGGGSFDHQYNWWDPTDRCDYPCSLTGGIRPPFGHGTSTTGISVGDDGGANQIGVAPGAHWIAANGLGTPDYRFPVLLSAMEWMIAPWEVNDFDPGHPTADPSQRPHAINVSTGHNPGSPAFDQGIQAWRAAGIFASWSAGNSGIMGCGSVASPADSAWTFGIGATDINDDIGSFSARGSVSSPSWLNLYPKTGPDVSAPGAGVRSAGVGNSYQTNSGTSRSSPHTAGVVALLWSAEPDLIGRMGETEEILRRTAVPLTSDESCGGVPGDQIPNNTFGWGRIDALAAVEMVWQAGTLAGAITDAGSGAPLPQVQVLAHRSGYTLTATTEPAGDYDYLLGQGSYTITVRAYNYQPWTTTNIVISQDLTTTLDVALTPMITRTLTGRVEGEDLAAGDPVQAQLGLWNTPITRNLALSNQPYTATLPQGSYLMRVIAPGYLPAQQVITLTGDLSQSLSLEPTWTYYLRDSRSICGPSFDWIDATDGVPHYLDIVNHARLYLPNFAFPFYGETSNWIKIGGSGWVSLGSEVYPDLILANLVIPFEGLPNNVIYAFGEWLNPLDGAQGIIYHRLEGVHRLVIEYHQVEHTWRGHPETFEIIMDKETGAILIQYQEVSLPDFATVGVERGDGLDATVYAQANPANITDSLAVGFYPVFGAPPVDQTELGVYGSLSGTVTISGTSTPIPGAVVTATTFLRTVTATTDAAGRYLMPGLCADLYTLQAAASGYRPSQPIQVRHRWPDDILVNDLTLALLPPAPTIDKAVHPAAIIPGDAVTYTIALTNDDDGDLIGALLSDTLPVEVSYITSTPPANYYNGTLTWTVDLPAYAAADLTIAGTLTSTVAPGVTITNTAVLYWDQQSISSSVSFQVRPSHYWICLPLIFRDG